MSLILDTLRRYFRSTPEQNARRHRVMSSIIQSRKLKEEIRELSEKYTKECTATIKYGYVNSNEVANLRKEYIKKVQKSLEESDTITF